jgi:cytochrome c-type biogenesis protein CcmH
MMLWFIFALMTAAAIFAVLWPLSRGAVEGGGSDVAVYRDQLDEIGRDRAAGLIGEAEAQAAKVEVSRRLIAAADDAETKKPDVGSPLWRRRLTAAAALLLLPAGAVALYLMVGSPQLPGEPLQARLRAIHGDHSIAAMVEQVEAHLAQHPDDVRGYEVLAPVYLQIGRFDDAVNARRKILALAGETAERQADLGEALTAQANGVVTAEAKSAFTRALALDANDPKAEFFTGIAAQQDGDSHKAAAIWHGMLEKAPSDAPWAATVREMLARVGGIAPPATSAPSSVAAATPGPSAADIAASANMNRQDRSTMINAMVARLASRLRQNGSNPADWLQLVRSYRVLGENEKANAAIADARHALAGAPDKLKTFNDQVAGTASAAAAPSPAATAAEPGPSAADIASAAQMSEQDRSAMIRGMVARLASQLKQKGDDIEGWQRLLRAYMVLNERDKAHAAAADARRALASDPDKLRRIEDTIKSLGLES